MSDPVVPTPAPTPDPTPASTPAPTPDPKPAEKKLLDDLKKEQAKRKELEAKLAEAQPYVEKFKGHEDAKALEAKREAEARAKQESEIRIRQEIDGKRERAILKSLLGVVPPGDDELAEFAVWKLSSDKSIVYDPETDTFTGLAEARDALKASPRFAAGKPGELPKKPTPGLPAAPSASGIDSKFANVKTFIDLTSMGLSALNEFSEKYPEKYAALKLAHNQGLSSPTRVLPPAVLRSN